ncbi:MAG: PTS transporter subunit EIIB, partial [Serratia liquefaciens]|nr:PTS transporter subunit EIIB [Serratia liquefaciens]
MPKNYTEISHAIVDALGGRANIEAVTHCMTRLRFVVKDK